MRGAGTHPVPYVPSDDIAAPEDEKTIIWIRPKNTKMGAYASRRYAQALGDEDGGYKPEDFIDALVDDCCAAVARIDNYAPSDEFIRAHPGIEINDKGFTVTPIMKPEDIREVVYDWMDGVATEVCNVSGNRVRLDAGAKKNLSWSSSLQSGGPLPPSGGDSSPAKSA